MTVPIAASLTILFGLAVSDCQSESDFGMATLEVKDSVLGGVGGGPVGGDLQRQLGGAGGCKAVQAGRPACLAIRSFNVSVSVSAVLMSRSQSQVQCLTSQAHSSRLTLRFTYPGHLEVGRLPSQAQLSSRAQFTSHPSSSMSHFSGLILRFNASLLTLTSQV